MKFDRLLEIRLTTRNITLNAFALDAHQGRTREPLNILGEQTRVKLTNADNDDAVAVYHQTIPRRAGGTRVLPYERGRRFRLLWLW
jgi:hypothetical protein